LGIPVSDLLENQSRIGRWRAQGLTALEWQAAHAAAMAAHGGAEMFELMAKNTCMLVLDWVPGGPLLAGDKDGPFQPARLLQTASDLGRQAGQFIYEKLSHTRNIIHM